MSTAAEVVEFAGREGLTFELTDSKLLMRGGTAERRAELAPVVRPLAKAIAAMLRRGAAAPADKLRAHLMAIPPIAVPEASAAPAAVCTLGQVASVPCPACRYTHGSLAEPEPCSSCGARDWVACLVNINGTARTCSRCILTPPGAPVPARSKGTGRA